MQLQSEEVFPPDSYTVYSQADFETYLAWASSTRPYCNQLNNWKC